MNFNMSDRDKKLLIGLCIVAVLVLPYVFYIKDTRIDTDNIKANNIGLQQRLDELREMEQNREFWLAEIDRLHQERDELVARYPADIRKENYTMFLLNTEYSSVVKDEDGNEYLEYPLRFNSVVFGNNNRYQISADGAEDVLYGVSNVSVVSFVTYYDGAKYLMDYLMQYPDPMIYSELTLSISDPEIEGTERKIIGTATINQYAIAGGDRELAPAVIWPDLDDFNRRGNEETSIFGPLLPVEERELIDADGLVDEEEDTDAEAGEGEGAAEEGEAAHE